MWEDVRKEQKVRCGTCIFYDLKDEQCHYNPKPFKRQKTDWCGKYVNEENMMYFIAPIDLMRMDQMRMQMAPLMEGQEEVFEEPAEDYGDE